MWEFVYAMMEVNNSQTILNNDDIDPSSAYFSYFINTEITNAGDCDKTFEAFLI